MKITDLAVIGAVALAAAAIVILKPGRRVYSDGAVPQAGAAAVPAQQALPRLVDLGAVKCIPCKAMKPILDALSAEYADVFRTEFIDVWEQEDAAKAYGVKIIPTQIFYSAEGKELFRHEGFMSKEDILAKWKELGVGEGGHAR
jgi:thioredoxin 1